MVKLHSPVVIALAFVGVVSTSTFTAADTSVGCNGAELRAGGGCGKAWMGSESTRTLRIEETDVDETGTSTSGDSSMYDEPQPTEDPSLTNEEPTEDPSLSDFEPTDDPSLSDFEPTDPPMTGDTNNNDGQTTDAPTTTPEPTSASPSTTISSPVVTSPPAPVTPVTPVAPVCSARPQRGDQLVGVDIVTDASCVSGGLGCLGTVCRFCKRWDSDSSKHLNACDLIVSSGSPSTMTTPTTTTVSPVPPVVVTSAPAPQVTTQADVQCGAWLSTGDRMVGVLIALDDTCVKGGVGCITTGCRYCRSWETAQSRHMKSCSSFSSVATPLATPTVAPVGPGAGPSCDNLLSSGDRAVGIRIVGDGNCFYGGLGCIGSSCRYCRVKDTPQSKHLMQCSAFPSGPTLEPTPAPIPAVTTSAPVTECAGWLTAGDRAVGVFVALDTTCTRGGVGCIRSSSCRYCRAKDTAQSHHLKACSQFSVVSPSSDASSVISQSFSSASTTNDGGMSALGQVTIVTLCVVGAIAVAGFVVKRFTTPTHDVELSTPTFISHRSVSVSTL